MARLPVFILLLLVMLSASSAAIPLILDSPQSNSVSGTALRLYAYTNVSANITVGVYSGSTLTYSNTAIGASFIDVSPTISEGNYTVVFNATSAVDATFASQTSTSVVVDSTDPTVSIDYPSTSNKKTISGGGAIVVNYTYSETNPLNATIEILSGSTSITSTFVNSGFVSGTGTKSDAVAFPSNQSQGSFSVRVTLRDKAGRSKEVMASDVIIFDTTAPSLIFSGPTNASKEYLKGSTDFDVLFKFTESSPQNITIKLLHENGTAIVTNSYTPAGGSDVSERRRISVPSAVPDGLYDINITIYDQTNQKANVFVSDAVVIDNTPPNITTFNLSSIVVNVGEAIAATCQATDNSQAWGGSINTSVQNIDTSRAKTGTALCSAVDMAGNDAWATMRYTVLEIGANATTNETNVTSNVTTNVTNVTNATDNVSVVVEQNSTNTTVNETNTSVAVTTPAPTPIPPASNATTTPQPASTPQPAPVETEADASGMSALLWGAIGVVVLGIVFGVMYAIGRGGGPSGGEKASAPEQYQGPADYVPSGQKVKLSELVKKPKEGSEPT